MFIYSLLGSNNFYNLFMTICINNNIKSTVREVGVIHSYLSEAKHSSVVAGICGTPFVWNVILSVLPLCLILFFVSSETPQSSFKIRTCVQVRAHTRSFQLCVFPVSVIPVSSSCTTRAKPSGPVQAAVLHIAST